MMDQPQSLQASSTIPSNRPSHSLGNIPRHNGLASDEEKAVDIGFGGTLEPLASPSQADEPPYSVFSKTAKRAVIFMATISAFFSPLSANIYFPALNQLAESLHVTTESINLTLTTYMIFQGLAPTFVGDFADSVGRRPAYLLSFVVYVGACIGCALVPNFAGLLVLRMVQSSGSSGTMSLASGVVADVSVSSERGSYMGWAMSGAMIAPAIGPIIGGLLSQYLGWRAIFWFLVVIGGLTFVILLLFMPETGRRIVGNGSKRPQSWNFSILALIQRRRTEVHSVERKKDTNQASRSNPKKLQQDPKRKNLRFPNPLKALKVLREKDASLVLLFNSLNFAAYYQLTASLPYLFQQVYHYDTLQVALCFIPFGVGCMLAPTASGILLDWNFRRVARRAHFDLDSRRGTNTAGFPLERARIPVAWPMALLAVIAEIVYGWVLEIGAPLAAPLVMTFIMGFAFTSTYNVSMVMLVDYYPQGPATATSAVNLCRCLLGAGATALIIYMIDAMGRGWCFTFVGLVLLTTTPALVFLEKFGPKWREERRERAQRQDDQDKETG